MEKEGDRLRLRRRKNEKEHPSTTLRKEKEGRE